MILLCIRGSPAACRVASRPDRPDASPLGISAFVHGGITLVTVRHDPVHGDECPAGIGSLVRFVVRSVAGGGDPPGTCDDIGVAWHSGPVVEEGRQTLTLASRASEHPRLVFRVVAGEMVYIERQSGSDGLAQCRLGPGESTERRQVRRRHDRCRNGVICADRAAVTLIKSIYLLP
jgi:hypothetical protein